MAFDLDGFVKELGLTAEEETTVRASLGKPERLALLEKNQLRQADYSKNQNALQKEREKLAAQETRLNAEAVEYANLSAAQKVEYDRLLADHEKTQARVLTLTQRATRIATDAGLDPAKALEGLEQEPVKKEAPVAPPFDTSKFVGQDVFGQFGNYMFTLATELPMLAAEHQALTGQALDTRALATEIQARAGKKGVNLDPRAIWEEVHGIQAKREAKATAQRETDLKEAEQRGFERARSEAALPVPPSHGLHSPVLRGADGNPRESKLQRPAPESGVRSAASALATGKYRQTAGVTK